MMYTRALAVTTMVIGTLFVAGCSDDDTAAPQVLQLVGLGDSVMTQGTDDNTSFVHQFAAQIESKGDATVEVRNRGNETETSDSLLLRLRNDESLRNAIREADIVVVSVGGNDADPFGTYPAGTCTGEPAETCLSAYAPNLVPNMDAIAGVIGELRGGKPTALRLLSDYNPMIGWPDAPDPDFGVRFFAKVLEAQGTALCTVASDHGGKCLETFRVLGGPDGLQDEARFLDADHNHPGPAGLTAIANALTALGIAELDE